MSYFLVPVFYKMSWLRCPYRPQQRKNFLVYISDRKKVPSQKYLIKWKKPKPLKKSFDSTLSEKEY